MIVAAVVALLALPSVVLRRRTLAAYYATDLATWLFAALVWRQLPSFDPYLGSIVIAVLKIATFSLFLARGRDVRWSPNHAAAIAAIVYALAIPAMLRSKIDGDEPFYLLVTESLVHDRDLDLANQYRTLDRTASGRTDLAPQFGDPRGPRGEQYSRHEPFLALLMIPGYAIGGLYGAIATIALFGVLLVRSTVRWMEDEGISDVASRAVFPFFAFAPPILFYATRIWPEVPAAFCYVEVLRGIRNRRAQRWVPALVGLVMLKLRFLLVAIGLIAVYIQQRRPRMRTIVMIAAIVVLPMLVAFLITGSATNVHSWREIVPGSPSLYARGFAGLLADGMSGIAFQAPFYLFALFALTRWPAMPFGFRAGVLASLLYILYLLPRPEWFGGWAPPLRYIVFLIPVLALGAAAVWERVSRGAIAVFAAWTIGLVIHGLAYPWRMFHLANGENAVGEWLSALYATDVSRLFPSFIRTNAAAWIGFAVVVAIAVAGVRRSRIELAIPLIALALAFGSVHARQPGSRVEFEDAHVRHEGGELYPELYTVMRVTYRGGWVIEAGESMTFLARGGPARLHYISGPGAMIELGGRAYQLAPTVRYASIPVVVSAPGRVTLRCLSGSVNLDRMDHD